MHVLVVVADHRGRLGWNRVRERFADDGSGKKLRGPQLMSAMQDRFYEDVASRFGLQRGSNSGGDGSASKRQPIDREKGIQARIDEETTPLRGELARMEQELAREREKRSAAVKRARRAGQNEGFEAGKKESLDRVTIKVAQEARTGLVTVRRERDAARTNLAAVTEERDAARTNLAAVTEERDAARTNLAAVTEERDALDKTNRAWKDYSDRLTKERDALGKTIRDWKGYSDKLTKERDAARTNLAAVTKERDALGKTIRDWKGYSDRLTKERDAARTNLAAAVERAVAAEQARDRAIADRDQARGERDAAAADRDRARERAAQLKMDLLVAGTGLTGADVAATPLTADGGIVKGSGRTATPHPRARGRNRGHER